MRCTILIAVMLLAGCASRPSLEALEQEALVTGDWTAVENREQKLKRRQESSDVVCPGNQVKVCYEDGVRNDCHCVR